jgi:hypothetical protein
MCLQVATTEWLLHEMLASVHRNILRPVRVSVRMETKFCSYSNDFLHDFSFFPCFVPAAFILEQLRFASVAGGDGSGAGGSQHFGGCPCCS